MKRVKRSVSLALHRAEARSSGTTAAVAGAPEVLLVQRPEEDEDLPLAWGLPAASLAPGEGWEDAVRRAAREKLGVEVEPGELLREGRTERASYTLEMRLYAARILAGEPTVPQPVQGVTQYRAWRWGPADALEPAARDGSLCSRLYLGWKRGLPD